MKSKEELAEEWAFDRWGKKEITDPAHPIPCKAVRDAFVAGYQAAQPKWISVEDRLPTEAEGKECVVRLDIEHNSGICAVARHEGQGEFVETWEDWAKLKPTHWIPLPEPPKEEK